jgi:hypothetical protein
MWIAVDKRRRPATKQALRERIWRLLERRRVGRFPLPLADRIPNFAGAEAAAERLAALPEWRAAQALKCNPDAPQRAVRLRALREGKDVYVAVPRLADALGAFSTSTRSGWAIVWRQPPRSKAPGRSARRSRRRSCPTSTSSWPAAWP